MSSQIIIEPTKDAVTSGFINIKGSMLPVTFQSNGLVAAEEIVMESVDISNKFATGRLIATAAPANGETVTIGTQIYTFSDPFVDAANNIFLGDPATLAETINNLTAAINGSPGEGTLYGTGTLANENVRASASQTATGLDTINVKAINPGTGANSVTTTDTWSTAAWDDPTLTGGSIDDAIPVLVNTITVKLLATHNRDLVDFPGRFRFVKTVTVAKVGLSVAYNDEV